jgi:hypothetical protein
MTTRTRPYTWPETLHAIARALTRPGSNLDCWGVDRHTTTGTGLHEPSLAAYIRHLHPTPADLLAWARFLDPLHEIRLARSEDDVVTIVGRIPDGPYVQVVGVVAPLPIVVVGSRLLTVGELADVALTGQVA